MRGPRRLFRCMCLWLGVLLLAGWTRAAEPAAPAPKAKDPVREDYEGYTPDFIGLLAKHSGYGGQAVPLAVPAESMKLSQEKGFYTLALIEESERAYALVQAAMEKEGQGEYQEALDIYQKVLNEFGRCLFRVSDYGVFVPAAQYCQRRMLNLPRRALAHYRTKYDAVARESYDQALRSGWLVGFSDILGNLMATSYGDKSLFLLGRAAIDKGYYLQAMECFTTIRDYYRDSALRGEELDLCIRLCQKMLGRGESAPSEGAAPRTKEEALIPALRKLVETARPAKPEPFAQLAAAPNHAADDYTLFPPSQDPLALKDPVWREALPASRGDFLVFSQPVITGRSILYRHKNIAYCRSIFSGELRWKNDMGGRVVWQSIRERQYPMEDILVKDGLVFTPMHKVGASLVALDEVGGQLKWAHGPMLAASAEEAKMRFEAAPAAGPEGVFAGYVLDDIEGQTHIDTEYGIIAFEGATGRVLWQTPVCRRRPGKFTTGFAEYRRNRVRSFSSPPLYHEGTVYHCSNAGVVVALDALSGRVKWLMRYPSYPTVHDATVKFGGIFYEGSGNPWRPHSPMFWFNQRPLLMGDRLIVMPVDTRFMLCLDRKTGKVAWSLFHPDGYVFVGGPTREGHLVLTATARADHPGAVWLVDPGDKGKVVWQSPPAILHDGQPVMKYPGYVDKVGAVPGVAFNQFSFYPGTRAFLTTDGRLSLTSWIEAQQYGIYPPWCYHLTEMSLEERRILAKRRHYSSLLQAHTANLIAAAPRILEALESVPQKNPAQVEWIPRVREIAADHPPVNKHGRFMPFSRMTFERFGVPFELRFGPQELSMLYDTGKLASVLASRSDPDAEFTRGELAAGEGRYEEAAERWERCLRLVSPEDVDFRTQVNQQLYAVQKGLARLRLQSAQADKEWAHAQAMSRAATQLADEIETLFVLSETSERRGDHSLAARHLQGIVERYGHHEFAIPSFLAGDLGELARTVQGVLEQADTFPAGALYAAAAKRSLALLRKGLPVYFTMLTPVNRDLTVRAGDWATGRLVRLLQASDPFRGEFEQTAEESLKGASPEEQYHRVRAYPATKAAQAALEALLNEAAAREADNAVAPEGHADARRRMWLLADLARVCGLTLPEAHRARLLAPQGEAPVTELKTPLVERKDSMAEPRSPAWLVLERSGESGRLPDALFLGARVREKLGDFKFLLYCMEMGTGKLLWKAQERRADQWFDEIRLGTRGEEPGFSQAFVYGDVVVVHGLCDVLAFGLDDGKLRWRFRVPHTFEIRHAVMSGELLALAGDAETMALCLGTKDPRGEVVWQEKEEGKVYVPPYFCGDRLVEVRHMPSAVTVRYRSTGKLIGRLALPDLLPHDEDPLLPAGPRALPAAHDGNRLVLTDGFYYLMVDVEKMRVVWKRLIDANDPTRLPPLRMELKGDYLAVVKQDFDVKAIYMLASGTGDVLWRTDPKVPGCPQPISSMFIHSGRLYGIKPHPGRGFYFAGMDCKTGKELFAPVEQTGYGDRPECILRRGVYGKALVVAVRDRQDFELKVFGAASGALLHTVGVKGTGTFGEHGGASATVQNGRLVLMGMNELVTAFGR